ncbi:MAG: amino acid adenylation domain-containing protein [Oscillospiraceae bacterium]|nr:amino acid adenylation domain-containing protein [Oscillospiraceae bacterium]
MANWVHEGSAAFPLSHSQKNIWDLERAYSGTSINHITTSVRIQGQFHPALLQKCVRLILASDPSLRARVRMQGDQPVQYLAPAGEEPVPVFDFSLSGQEGVESWAQALAREPIPVLESALYRFWIFKTGENDGGILFKLHHLISDGWSQVLFCNKLQQTYLDLVQGRDPQLPQAPAYGLHVQEEERYLQSAARTKDETYWAGMLDEGGDSAALRPSRGASVSPVGSRKRYLLPKSVSDRMMRFCEQRRVAPFAVFYMALAIYLKKAARLEKPVIGVPVLNRTTFSAKQTTGMFVSTLPFLCPLDGTEGLSRFSELFIERWYDLLRHQRLPFGQIERLAEEKGMGGVRLFQIALSYQDSHIFTKKDDAAVFSGCWYYSGFQAEQLCIHLSDLAGSRQFTLEYDYLTQMFSEEEIAVLHQSLTQILDGALADPEKPVGELGVLPPPLRDQVLYRFNKTEKPLPELDLYEKFSALAASYPTRTALIQNGERTDYQALERQAARAAAALEDAGLAISEKKNDFLVAILLHRTSLLYGAMMGAMRAGAPYLLLSCELPAGRIREILAQSGAKALVSVPAVLDELGLRDLGIPVINMEDLPERQAPVGAARPDDLAYVVYTSGSTGAPKGVEISRRSLLNLSQAMQPVYATGAVLSVCNVGFDAFVLESAAAMLDGRTVVLPRDRQQESPQELAGLIFSFGVGFLSLTPSRLAVFLRQPDFARAVGGLRSIVCGGEAFPATLLHRLQQLTTARIYNQYGPSETTVGVSIKCLNGCTSITVGRPMENCRMYVLDRWMQPLPVGVYGDLYIGGVCVGQGYRGAPQLTEQSFFPSPFELGERIYRTGDLACWAGDGELILAGRTDRQVKLRGLRIEPQEVAVRLAAHPQVKAAAASVFEQNGQGILAAYYTSDEPVPQNELLGFIGEYLPRYMIPSYITRLERMPLTANGKVDEKRLPAPQITAGAGQPQSQREREILEIFRRVLSRPQLGAEDDYFLHGGNSLNAMEAIGEITGQTGRTLRIMDLYACRCARRIAQFLDGLSASAPARLEKAPVRQNYPLSPVQQSIYVQSCREEIGDTYHMPGAFALSSAPDIRRLEAAFQALVAGDTIFRTSFHMGPEGLYCQVAEQVPFELPILEGQDLDEAAGRFLRPFELSQAPLMRAALWQENAGRWHLLLDSHHIIGDGMSTPLMMDRLDRLYRGEPAPAPETGYLDYAFGLGQESASPADRAYWNDRLSPLPEELDLPTDYPRPPVFDFKGGQVAFVLPQQLSGACDRLCEQQGITPFMLFLTAFGILLSAVSGRRDLLVGTPVAGRQRPELQKICGPFLNTLPLRLVFSEEMPLADCFEQARRETAGMLDHQAMPLEELASMLELPRTLSQNPLYQALFSLRPLRADRFTLGGEPMAYRPIPTNSAKLDLSLEAAGEEDGYHFTFEYAVSLFAPETIRLYARSYEAILLGLTGCAAQTVGDLPKLSLQDQLTYWEEPNLLAAPYLNQPLHCQIERRALLNPEGTAYFCHGKAVSYRQLLNRARRVAGLLEQEGAVKGDRVGLCCRRDEGLFEGLLGILMAGCAYVPFLYSYPTKRIAYMMETAGAKIALCGKEARPRLEKEQLPCRCVALGFDGPALTAPRETGGEDLMYVLFTSGSTGQPKGVMLRHRALSNLLGSMKELMAGLDGPILCITNVVFDTFITESLLPLALGIPVVLADDEQMLLPWQTAALIETYAVRMAQFTPSRLRLCLGSDVFCTAAAGLDRIILVGEAVTDGLFRDFRAVSRARVLNMYGPTEAAVYVTVADLQDGQPVHIGKALRNCRIYVLDENRRPVLPTARGELYLAGDCLAQGYIGRDELTDQLFPPDPFFPGQRMYQSGDIGRLRPDGNLDFLGRRDAQVKINGQRVELGEISETILKAESVAEAAVLPLKQADGSTVLIAFFTCAGDNPPDREKLRRQLQDQLPSYMVPAFFRQLPQMPYTASGKLDLPRLRQLADLPDPAAQEREPLPETEAAGEVLPAKGPAPEKESGEPEPFAEPVREDPPNPAREPADLPKAADLPVEETLLDIWRQVLGGETLLADRSFFEQGGSSLAALNVLSRYFNKGYSMTLAQFYEHPTARQQALLLGGGPGPDAPPPSPPARESANSPPAARPLDTVLLTGATGFLGAHLLAELLQSGAQTVVCLLRDGSGARLLQTLCDYFGYAWMQENTGKIEIARGDVSLPGLGMAPADYETLARRVQDVYHSAADVRHYAADEDSLMAVNVGGTGQMIAFAQKAGAVLHHISTASVSGEYLPALPASTAQFGEEDLDIGQNWRDNQYIKSKFLAEQEVSRSVLEGLDARVYRVGRLVGRAADGVFQKNPEQNAFFLLLRGAAALGALPESLAKAPVDLTPVDVCAREIVALRQGAGRVWHLLGRACPLETAVRAVSPWLRTVPDADFSAVLARGLKEKGPAQLASLVDLWNRVQAGPAARIKVSDTKTRRQLAALGIAPEPEAPAVLLQAFRRGE